MKFKASLVGMAAVSGFLYMTEVNAMVARTVMTGVNIQTPARKCLNRAGTVDVVAGANVNSAFNKTRIICAPSGMKKPAWIIDGEARSFDTTHAYLNSGKIYFNCLDDSNGGFTCSSYKNFKDVYVMLDVARKKNEQPRPHPPIRVK
jgi:hypothetical protein